MYKKYKVGSEIALWCDVQDADETEEAGEDKRKRKHPDSHPSKRQDGECQAQQELACPLGSLLNLG